MTPTREQIIEGRDEALLHLRIPPFVFDSVEYPERQAGALRRAMVDDVDTSAVLTVVEAMALTTTAGVAAHWWGVRVALFIRAIFKPPTTRSDFTLQT